VHSSLDVNIIDFNGQLYEANSDDLSCLLFTDDSTIVKY